MLGSGIEKDWIRTQTRHYRRLVERDGLVNFAVAVGETDLHISAMRDLRELARGTVLECRRTLQEHIARDPLFRDSLVPLRVDADAPLLIRAMAEASASAGVGPMAAVAGAIAEAVGRRLIEFSDEVIVENGGDIFMRTLKPCTVAIFAGNSPFSLKVGLQLDPAPEGLGMCTSAATVGHSLSFGQADAAVALSLNAALADAWATATANAAKGPASVETALNLSEQHSDVLGVVVIVGNKLGARGQIRLARVG